MDIKNNRTVTNMAAIDNAKQLCFRRWIYRHASYADLANLTMLIAGTLAGDLAGTNFVLSSDRLNPTFSNCSNDKYLIEIQIYVNN